jgi:hypothetical protein
MGMSVKERAKSLVQTLLPGAYAAVQRGYGNAGAGERVAKEIVARHGRIVLGGPFVEMKYVEGAVCSAYAPKLIGSYEAELHDVICHCIHRRYRYVIDVGCAEGYYAVGFARVLPEAKVFAFDTDPEARRLCAEMAGLNGVAGRVSVEGLCDVERLRSLPLEDTLLISDCEGFELELLRPESVPALRGCDILVELHDCFRPGLTTELAGRFVGTHDVRLIDTAARQPERYPVLESVRPKDRLHCMAELRPGPMQWAFMTPLER